jgi:hypothetical protein
MQMMMMMIPNDNFMSHLLQQSVTLHFEFMTVYDSQCKH